MFEKLKLTGRIIKDAISGRCSAETLIPKLRNKVTLEIIRADGSREVCTGYNTRINASFINGKRRWHPCQLYGVINFNFNLLNN